MLWANSISVMEPALVIVNRGAQRFVLDGGVLNTRTGGLIVLLVKETFFRGKVHLAGMPVTPALSTGG